MQLTSSVVADAQRGADLRKRKLHILSQNQHTGVAVRELVAGGLHPLSLFPALQEDIRRRMPDTSSACLTTRSIQILEGNFSGQLTPGGQIRAMVISW